MAITSVSASRQSFSIAAAAYIVSTTVISLFAAVHRSLFEWRRRARGRHELRTMTDLDLLDAGISRATAEHEASKPFWQP